MPSFYTQIYKKKTNWLWLWLMLWLWLWLWLWLRLRLWLCPYKCQCRRLCPCM